MDLKTFVANIGGGDALTPDNDLYYRIYGSVDNYTTPISTTGSHVTDANVVIANGIVTIAGIEVGSSTSYKIVSVNQQGFEAPLSDIFSINLFQDDFSEDLSLWDVTNPDSGNISIGLVSEQLKLANIGTGSASTNFENNALSNIGKDVSVGISIFAFDMEFDNSHAVSGPATIIGCFDALRTNGVYIAKGATDTNEIRIYSITAGSTVVEDTVSITPYASLESMRIDFNKTTDTCDVKHHNGTSWVTIATFSYTIATTLFLGAGIKDNIANGYVIMDNALITEVNFTTLRP